MAARLTLRGVPLSQPVRAVLWGCAIKRLPIKFQLAVPGVATRGGTRSPDFLARHPLGTVPALEVEGPGEAPPLNLCESTAILVYLAEQHGPWDDLWPRDPAVRARALEFLSWSHSGLRPVSLAYFAPFVRPDKASACGDDWREHGLKTVKSAATTLDSYWLARTPFLAAEHPTIADLCAYEELTQFDGGHGALYDYAPHANVRRWLDEMARLPFHDEIHASLALLGPLDALAGLEPKQLGAKLGAATKGGVASMQKALAD